MVYLARVVDRLMEEYLAAMGGVLVEGPRGCGKTSTGLEHTRSSIRLDSDPSLIALAELNPAELLAGPTPRLIDEWQLAPALWNQVRHEIDDRQSKGQFILSGSAVPADDVVRHSGAGRIARLRMRTMSLAESGRSSGQVSLASLRDQDQVSATSPLSYKDLAAEAVRGGWPGLLDASERQAILYNRSYLENLAASELTAASGTKHDAVRMRRLLESIARNIAGEATFASLAKDVAADGGTMGPDTIRRYLDALTQVFAFEELPAWSVALRSRSRLRTSPKLLYADPSLACAALGVGVDRLAKDPEYFGQVFEAMVIRDLRVLASAGMGEVYHYRDNTGLEVDAIIEYWDGTWAAAEVKLGASQVPKAEENLLRLRDSRVDVGRVRNPAFLAIITGTQYAYTLSSGVHVVPLGVLAI